VEKKPGGKSRDRDCKKKKDAWKNEKNGFCQKDEQAAKSKNLDAQMLRGMSKPFLREKKTAGKPEKVVSVSSCKGGERWRKSAPSELRKEGTKLKGEGSSSLEGQWAVRRREESQPRGATNKA